MPELPEAETIARDLRRHVVGRKVTGVQVTHADVLGAGLTPQSPLPAPRRPSGSREVGRRAKNVVLRFEDGPVLVVNLGMTGRLVVSEAPKAPELRHVAVRFDLDHGGALLYDDIRRFGRLDLYSPETWEEKQRELGVEPLSDEFTRRAAPRADAALAVADPQLAPRPAPRRRDRQHLRERGAVPRPASTPRARANTLSRAETDAAARCHSRRPHRSDPRPRHHAARLPRRQRRGRRVRAAAPGLRPRRTSPAPCAARRSSGW